MADVLTERRGEVAWITMNRPERHNAYDRAMADQLISAVRDAEDAGVIVLTGAGRAFCAGGYLRSLAAPEREELRGMFFNSLRLFDEIRLSPRPVIACVNGAAAGGGNELLVACDLAVAAESATFGQTEPRVGSAAVLGGTNLVSLQVGEKRGKEIAFLARRYTAAEALAWGLVNAVVPDAQLEAATTAMAEELLANSPRYLEIAKASSNVWWNQARHDYVASLTALVQAIGSEDMVEGATAFMEKRAPRWPGRAPREGTAGGPA